MRVPAPRTDCVPRHVLRDVKQPSCKLSSRTIALSRSVHAQEHVLGQILCFLPVAELAIEAAEHAHPITADQLGEGAWLVTLHAQHQGDIGILRWQVADCGLRIARVDRRRCLHISLFPPQKSVQSAICDLYQAGSCNRNVVPCPGSLSTAMRPPIRSM